MSTNREKIAAKIRALLSKTVSAGCTEEEALSAATLANELMLEYEMSREDIESIKKDSYGARRRKFAKGSVRRRSFHEVVDCVVAIGKLNYCKCYRDDMDLVFFGEKTDTEIAHYMTDLIRNSMDFEFQKYLQSPNRDLRYHGKTLRATFLAGMARRINERLRDMLAEKENKHKQASTTGTALVLLKNQVTESKYEDYKLQNGLKLSSYTYSKPHVEERKSSRK
jgi:hypothetical protein